MTRRQSFAAAGDILATPPAGVQLDRGADRDPLPSELHSGLGELNAFLVANGLPPIIEYEGSKT